MKHGIEELDRGQLDLMWNFLRFDCGQKSDIPTLKEHLDMLRQAMIQKTGGQEKHKDSHDVSFNDVGTIINCIVIETMQLYLSGDLDKLEKLKVWIEQIPGGQPKTGRWEHDGGRFANRWICSQCGYKFYFEKSEAKYCPNCGAKMESENKKT